MPNPSDRKLYLGPRLRTLRRELGLNQTQMAEELGVSPSYLNHLERNQRPLTAQMLLRLAEAYDIDVRSFVAASQSAATSDLHEIFADELVREIGIGRQEVLDVAENYPGVGEAVKRLYRALADLRQLPARVETATGLAETRVASPLAWVRDWLEAQRNHFADLDTEAEAVSLSLGGDPDALRGALVARLQNAHGTSVRIMPRELIPASLHHYDYHRRRLMLSERLPASARLFALAAQLARLELADAIAAVVTAAEPPNAETRALAQQVAVNYAAAAIAMPYTRFHAAAEASRYNMDLLVDRFGCSYEQVAHRLTTLDRSGARGVPLFLLKLDTAGNVAKRYAGEAAPLARYGGGCPRWQVHRAFRRLGETVVDRAAMPDGTTYLSWGRAVQAPPGEEPRLVVLGCEQRYADRIGYAEQASGTTPIGAACHLCERPDCPERSLPPITRALDIHPLDRPRAPYPFRPV